MQEHACCEHSVTNCNKCGQSITMSLAIKHGTVCIRVSKLLPARHFIRPAKAF